MTIKQQGGVFGRNPTFNDVTIEGQLTFDGDIDINSDLKVNGNLDVVEGMTVDANTLVVDAINNRVGIGTDSPAYLMNLKDSNGADLALSNSTVSPSAGDYLGRIYALDSGNNFFAGINMFYHDDNDGEIRFRIKTDGTNANVMTLVDGHVGIGTDSPSSYQANADDLVVATTGHTGITIASGTTHLGNIHFADGILGDDAYRGFIQYDHITNYMRFATNASETMRIDSSGHAIIPAGVTLGTAVGTYNADNTLDDYEEGTWTPSVSAGAISGTSITYTGNYTKIGNTVTVWFRAENTAGDIQISSYAVLGTLPFTAAFEGTGAVTTEDIDQFSRQGFASVSGTTLALSASGSATGTVKLFCSVTYKV